MLQILLRRSWTRGQIFDFEHAVRRVFSGLAKHPVAELDDMLHRLQGEAIALCDDHGRRYATALERRFGVVGAYYMVGPCDVGGCTNGPDVKVYYSEARYERIRQRGLSAQRYLNAA